MEGGKVEMADVAKVSTTNISNNGICSRACKECRMVVVATTSTTSSSSSEA